MGKSFLGKIGNVLQDTASFALPAALTAGAAAATGGGSLGLQGALAALGAGAQGFQANEQGERARKFQRRQGKAAEEAQEANKLATGRSNLINSLNPRAGARPSLQTDIDVATPKPGFLETLAGGVGTGVDAFQTFQNAKALQEGLARQSTLEQAKIDSIRGSDAAARKGLEEVTSTGGPSQATFALPETTVTAKAPDEPSPLGFLSGAAAERRAETAQDIKRESNLTAIQVANSKANQELVEAINLARLVMETPSAFENVDQQVALRGLALIEGGQEVISQITGRDLTPIQQDGLRSGQDSFRLIKSIRDSWESVGSEGLGPVSARFNLPGGADSFNIKQIDDRSSELAAALRSARESGVMNDKDFERFMTLMPDPRALSPENEFKKLQRLEEGFTEAFDLWGKNLASIGTRTGGFTDAPRDNDRLERILDMIEKTRAGQ